MTKPKYILKRDTDGIPAGTLGKPDKRVFTFTNGTAKLTVHERHILTFAEPQPTQGNDNGSR
jgi:hypothetical protein